MNNTCKPNFDIFISYRSENIHTVRPIAEHLMGCGIKVWFAEYKVLLKGRERFNKAIREGATNCSYGLCFTNDSYAQSEHCQKEMQMLMDSIGPQKIINICHPEQPLTLNKFPDLQKENTFNYSDSIQVLKIIQSITGFDTGLSLDKTPLTVERTYFSTNGINYSINFGEWKVKKNRLSCFIGRNHRVASYSISFKDHRFFGHLIVGHMDVKRNVQNTLKNDDDREYYDRALHFAESFYQGTNQEPLGVHLLFVPDLKSQNAFTTRLNTGEISRLYSIIIERSQSQNDIELAFFFFYKGKLSDFFNKSYLMDSLVQSIVIENNFKTINKKINAFVVQPFVSLRQNTLKLLRIKRHGQLGKAVLKNNLQKVKELLSLGENPNIGTLPAYDSRGNYCQGTFLMAAANEGLEEIVVELLKHGAKVNAQDTRGWTALFHASENGYTNICRLLLYAGANPNIRSNQSGTALMAASIKGHTDIVKLLIEREADASIRDTIGKSALDFAYKYNWPDIISILKNRNK